jgi:hypothetical protein
MLEGSAFHMRIAKRAVSVILAAAVVLSNLSVSAFAADGESGGLTDAQIYTSQPHAVRVGQSSDSVDMDNKNPLLLK